MADAQYPKTSMPETSSSSGSGQNEAGDFECNICLDLAQDPVITLCGHLYCWPCLYKWLRGHSQSHECPVCKALIEEEKLIPLYGRGKTPTDPRSKPVPGVEIPNRPAGQRPETAPPPPPEDNGFYNPFAGLMGGFVPATTVNFSNFAISAGFGGAFLPFFGFQFHGFRNAYGYDGSSGFNFHNGRPDSSRDQEGQLNRGASQVSTPDDENLKKILLVVLLFVFIAFLII